MLPVSPLLLRCCSELARRSNIGVPRQYYRYSLFYNSLQTAMLMATTLRAPLMPSIVVMWNAQSVKNDKGNLGQENITWERHVGKAPPKPRAFQGASWQTPLEPYSPSLNNFLRPEHSTSSRGGALVGNSQPKTKSYKGKYSNEGSFEQLFFPLTYKLAVIAFFTLCHFD